VREAKPLPLNVFPDGCPRLAAVYGAHRLKGVGARPYPRSCSNVAVQQNEGRFHMAWDAPKVREIPVGMEINMYACAKQK
jgi:coenzyme PQQ precursor peptide PqqA